MRRLVLALLLTALALFQAGDRARCQTASTPPGGISPSTVANLPAASGSANKVYLVTDGSTNTDCTVGGGSTLVLCASNGSSWAVVPSGTAPTGNAGGVLNGTYPNPGFAASPAFTGTPTAPNPASSTNNTQLATTSWVARKLAALNPATAVAAATVTALPNSPAYANGSSGVGATLTASSFGALTIDGYTVLLNDRVLVNNQASALQNGVYTQTTLGDGSHDYVLTRATDFNTVSAINSAGVIPVTNGTVNNSTTWALDAAITTIGTSAINYDQTNSQPSALHNISFTIDGGGAVISTGALNVYPMVNYACTIKRIDISADQSGSVTIDVWKSNAAIPTSSNKISASAPLTLSSAQLSQAGSLTGWTTTVSTGDVFGFNVATASAVTKVVGIIWCQ